MAKWLVITGASQGIGKSTATVFMDNGWSVINISRRPCPIVGVHNLMADLSQIETITALKPKLTELLAGEHMISLVHNAAAFIKDNILTLDSHELQRLLMVNVIAATQLNQLIIPFMGTGSAIIYIGSTLSEKAVSDTASYVISKHAVVGMMRATCQDLFAKPGIHTCCVCPGFTATEMMLEHQRNNPELIAVIKQRTAVNRLIEPKEIAELIYFCANNPVINGSVIHGHLGQRER
ncbi:MAG: SDR family oxidoreductase [Coxiellaceae bacterium]|nr:MAG: SDR family oxidoreductase [Coxiellaceae bacterium]